jgi:hypothetical protein
MDLLAQYPQAGLCSTLSLIMSEGGEPNGIIPTLIVARQSIFLSPQKSLQTLHRYGSWFTGNTVIYQRQALIEAGGFIQELGSYCDGFIQEVIALRHGACFIPESLACWRRMETGYAATTYANFERSLAVLKNATQLIRSNYGDLFPSYYINTWLKRHLFYSNLSTWYKVPEEQKQFIMQSSRLLHFIGNTKPWLARLLMTGVQLSTLIQAIFVRLYLLTRFFFSYNQKLFFLKMLFRRFIFR